LQNAVLSEVEEANNQSAHRGTI